MPLTSPSVRWKWFWRGGALGLLLLVAVVTVWGLDRFYPPPLEVGKEVSVVVLDRNQRLLRPFTISDGRWRLPVTLEEIDPRFLEMLIAYEDRRFYHHTGVDPLALMRAAWQWLINGRIISGGSTITMQLARLIEPHRGRSLAVKFRQIARAFQIEARLSKRKILELYLTLAPYGGNLEGVRAASLAYFNKEPAKLRVEEAALLTALPQSPETRRPGKNSKTSRAALVARNRVLERMVSLNIIPRQDAVVAQATAVPEGRWNMPTLAAHLARDITRNAPEMQRHELRLDSRLQEAMEKSALRHARKFGRHISVAILAADHRSGEVLARVGSADFSDAKRAGHVDMTRAIRSPGSALKPFIYGMGFEVGIAHPETLIDDVPLDFDGYAPRNFDESYHGPVTVRKALERSLNVPAVSMLDAVGPARFMARLGETGITTRLPGSKTPSLALALGGLGVNLEGLVHLYGALARSGKTVVFKEIGNSDQAKNKTTQLLEPLASWYVSDILSGTPPPKNALRGKLAFKTGTSYGYRDAWSIGYDGNYVVGVWVGRPDGSAVPGLTGRKAAAPIMFESFALVAGGSYATLPVSPGNVIYSTNAELPHTLKHFQHGRHAKRLSRQRKGHQLDIIYPPDLAQVDLGLSLSGESVPLIVKINGGTPPYNWFANGAHIARIAHRRILNWKPDGKGFSTLTVRDAKGNTDTVSLLLQ